MTPRLFLPSIQLAEAKAALARLRFRLWLYTAAAFAAGIVWGKVL